MTYTSFKTQSCKSRRGRAQISRGYSTDQSLLTSAPTTLKNAVSEMDAPAPFESKQSSSMEKWIKGIQNAYSARRTQALRMGRIVWAARRALKPGQFSAIAQSGELPLAKRTLEMWSLIGQVLGDLESREPVAHHSSQQSTNTSPNTRAQPTILPLPEGEGRGEGKVRQDKSWADGPQTPDLANHTS